MNKKYALIGVVSLLVLVAIVWGLSWLGGKDPKIVELEQMRDEQFANRNQMSDADQQASRAAFGEKMKNLSEDQRRAFFEASAPMFMKMMEARLDHFLAMTPAEQKAEMDKKIDQSLASGRNGGGPGGGGPGASGGPGRGGDRPGGPPTPQQIDKFRKGMLDKTTPEQRAKFQMTMQMYQQRMKERGLDPKAGGGRFF